MRPRPSRLVGFGAAALAAVLVAGLGGCSGRAAPAPARPPAPAPSGRLTPPAGSAGSDGLTVRYLGGDGRVRTVRVEDFPH